MLKLIFVLLGILMMLSPSLILAEGRRVAGIVGYEHGSEKSFPVCTAGGDCVGDLVTCTAGDTRIFALAKITFLEGICDDSGSPQCAGRFFALDELCSNPVNDFQLNFPLLSFTQRGKFRICFDNSAQTDCTGRDDDLKAADVKIIADGTTRSQARAFLLGPFLPGPPPEFPPSPATVSLERIVENTKPFFFDGKLKRFEGKVLTGDGTAVADPNNCGGDGCPIAGTFYKME
jgi:hypothetical protein